MIHLRMTEKNTGTMCGLGPDNMSQSLLGMKLQGTIYDRFPIPKRGDYCPKCLEEYEQNAPAINALTHLPTL